MTGEGGGNDGRRLKSLFPRKWGNGDPREGYWREGARRGAEVPSFPRKWESMFTEKRRASVAYASPHGALHSKPGGRVLDSRLRGNDGGRRRE